MSRRPGPDTERAARAFEDFTGRQARDVTAYPLPSEDVSGWKVGRMVGVAYEATRDGQKSRYFHEFDKSSRPDLVASDSGDQLYIVGGSYKVADRGIEDMPEVFVVNPSGRPGAARKGKSMARAQRNAKGRFVKRASASRAAPRRRAAAAPRRRRRSATQVALFKANPIRRRRRRAAASTRRAPTGRRRLSFRRNPIGGTFGRMAVPAIGVALGAVITEIGLGYTPIPAAWKTGPMRQVSKMALGFAIGYGVDKVLRQKRLGGYIQLGALVIGVHDLAKEVIARNLTGVNTSGFGGMGYINPAATMSFGEYTMPLPNQFGEYVLPLPSQFGGASQAYPNPGGETLFSA